MTRRGVRDPVVLLLLAVLAISGAYVFVYLYRWQWNRALISGMFFVVAEVALATLAVLRRLHDLAALLGRPSAGGGQQATVPPVHTTSPRGAASGAFRWLEPTGSGMTVFVPVLMGVGVFLSALAFLVDRAATLVTPHLGSSPGRLGRLELPGEPLVAPVDLRIEELPPPPRQRRGHPLGKVLVIGVVAILAVAAIDVIADATQTRPEAAAAGQMTVIDLDVQHKRGRSPVQTAEALWGGATMVVPRSTQLVSLTQIGEDRVRLVVTPALGTHGRRRLRGALEDAVIDNVGARVVSIQTVDRP